MKPSLLEIVQTINPGAPLLPDWVHQGAILGLQGGTDVMLDRLAEVSGLTYPWT